MRETTESLLTDVSHTKDALVTLQITYNYSCHLAILVWGGGERSESEIGDIEWWGYV